MSMKRIYDIEARLAELEGAEHGLPEYLTELEDRLTDVDLRLKALEEGASAGIRERLDALELKVDLALPGKRTQRKG